MKILTNLLPHSFDEGFFIWTDLDEPITRLEVQEAITCGHYLDTPVLCPVEIGMSKDDQMTMHPEDMTAREHHIRRIAYFVTHDWPDAIVIDAAPGGWPVQDGNHRLAAAHFRGDDTIEAEFTGFEADIRELFGPEIATQAVAEWDEAV